VGHSVSVFAKTTICPSCAAAIELGNLSFSSNASRPVDLRGTLTVRAAANLNSSCVICTDAVIEGRITGTLYCESSLELLGSGRIGFKAFARAASIGKSARLELGFPLAVGSLEVRGQLHGPVVCSGGITIRKGGTLVGNFEARAIMVERGGALEGSGRITASGGDPAALLPGNIKVPGPVTPGDRH